MIRSFMYLLELVPEVISCESNPAMIFLSPEGYTPVFCCFLLKIANHLSLLIAQNTESND